MLRTDGRSSVATAYSDVDRSNAASTTSERYGGVSTMTVSKFSRAASSTLVTSGGSMRSASDGSRGAASTATPDS